MNRLACLVIGLVGLTSLMPPEKCFAAAGTDIVARPGQEVRPLDTWPKGVAELLNDPTRTDGWNDWFSEWSNDVCHYAFDVKNVDDVNRLLETFGKIESKVHQVHLFYKSEPDALGWVTRLPEKNGIAVLYSSGDQAQVDQWYGQVRKPFGKIEFTAAPVAVPPTLTLFVANEKIDLDRLKVPEGIEVIAGGIPGPFLLWNDKREQVTEEEAKELAKRLPKLSDDEQLAQERIEAFLKEPSER